MRILALDTATAATAVALCPVRPEAGEHDHAAPRRPAGVGRAIEARDDPPAGSRPRHTTRLLVLIEQALDGHGWGGVDRIAVGLGPGTFTGLRIGIATARALARARGLPLVGVGTLEALAHGHSGPVLAVLDARRGEAFAAAWDARGVLRSPAAAVTPSALESLAQELPSPLAVGDGAIRFRGALERAGARVPPDGDPVHRVSAVAHCDLAAGLCPRDPAELTPFYLREPDAKPARGRAVP